MPSHPTRTGAVAAAVLLALAAVVLAPDAGVAARARFACERPVPGDVVRLASIPHPNWLPGHRGVDLEAAPGDTVVAPASGTVTVAGTIVDRGVVAVRHAGGFVTSLEPVDATVAVGDHVAAGQQVGTVSWGAAAGSGHCGALQCLHWGLRHDGAYVDPLDYLEGFGQIRLLPVTG